MNYHFVCGLFLRVLLLLLHPAGCRVRLRNLRLRPWGFRLLIHACTLVCTVHEKTAACCLASQISSSLVPLHEAAAPPPHAPLHAAHLQPSLQLSNLELVLLSSYPVLAVRAASNAGQPRDHS